MSDTRQTIIDLAVGHRIGLGRYSNFVVRRVISQLNRVERDVVARIAASEPDTLALGRLEVLLEGIRDLIATGWQTIGRRFEGDLAELSDEEALFATRLVRLGAAGGRGVFSPVPQPTMVWAAVQARPFQGRYLREWLSGAEEGTARRVRETIRTGVIEGQTTSQIVRAIRGTRALRYRDGAMEISRRGAEAMVRTAITHTSAVAHEETYRQAGGIVKEVEWVSTLDSRTTLICASRDGKRYPVDKGPRPPAHVGCRSVTVPVLAKIEGVAEFNRQTYPEWLRKQPKDVQDDILGATRAKLFRSGEIELDRFVDRKGVTLTLPELRDRDASAFSRAGLQ